MAEFKESGNNFYRDGNYESAIVEYTKAVDALQAVVAASAASAASDSKGGDTDANTTILATVLSNRAQCYLKTDKFTAAAADCTACLVLDASTATNVKALYRRAVALEKLGQAKAALRDYGEVVRLDPSQAKGVNKARRRVTKAIRAAFAGGAEAGSGGRASSSRAVGVQPPKGGAMINGLTYEEANELRALKQRLMVRAACVCAVVVAAVGAWGDQVPLLSHRAGRSTRAAKGRE